MKNPVHPGSTVRFICFGSGFATYAGALLGASAGGLVGGVIGSTMSPTM